MAAVDFGNTTLELGSECVACRTDASCRHLEHLVQPLVRIEPEATYDQEAIIVGSGHPSILFDDPWHAEYWLPFVCQRAQGVTLRLEDIIKESPTSDESSLRNACSGRDGQWVGGYLGTCDVVLVNVDDL